MGGEEQVLLWGRGIGAKKTEVRHQNHLLYHSLLLSKFKVRNINEVKSPTSISGVILKCKTK
jgi:hypothetical protein